MGFSQKSWTRFWIRIHYFQAQTQYSLNPFNCFIYLFYYYYYYYFKCGKATSSSSSFIVLHLILTFFFSRVSHRPNRRRPPRRCNSRHQVRTTARRRCQHRQANVVTSSPPIFSPATRPEAVPLVLIAVSSCRVTCRSKLEHELAISAAAPLLSSRPFDASLAEEDFQSHGPSHASKLKLQSLSPTTHGVTGSSLRLSSGDAFLYFSDLSLFPSLSLSRSQFFSH